MASLNLCIADDMKQQLDALAEATRRNKSFPTNFPEKTTMPTSVTQLFVEASRLDEGDRAALAGLLLESLDQAPSPGVEAAWAEEIERLVRELDSGEVKTVAWEDVKNRLLAREKNG